MTRQNSTRETSQFPPLTLMWGVDPPNRTSATDPWESECTCFTLATLGLARFFISQDASSKSGANVSDWRSLTARKVENIRLGFYSPNIRRVFKGTVQPIRMTKVYYYTPVNLSTPTGVSQVVSSLNSYSSVSD